jgi:hypothetical protein
MPYYQQVWTNNCQISPNSSTMEYSFLVEHSDEMYWWQIFMLQSSLNITNRKGFLTTRSLWVSTSMSKISPNLVCCLRCFYCFSSNIKHPPSILTFRSCLKIPSSFILKAVSTTSYAVVCHVIFRIFPPFLLSSLTSAPHLIQISSWPIQTSALLHVCASALCVNAGVS